MYFLNAYSGLYWLTRLDYLQGLFIGLSVAFGLSSIVVLIWAAVNASEDNDWIANKPLIPERKATRKKWRAKTKWLIPLCVFCIITACLIPTRNEMIVILAGGKAIEYVQSDTSLQKIPYQTTTIISQYLENAIKELKEDKK